MLWLCLSLPELPLEALALPADRAVAVVDRKGSRRYVISCNPHCRAAGVVPGLEATAALARVQDLQLVERSARTELRALKALAGWAEQFTSFASIDPQRLALWLEIGTSLRYFGGLDPLVDQVRDSLAAIGYRAELGIGPTAEAALVVARAQASPISATADLRAELAPLPIRSMSLGDDDIDSLHSLGLRSIGDVLALPTDGLARRYGPGITNYLQRLTGRAPQVLPPCRAPQRYRRHFEFAGAIESFEGLLFPIRRILTELEGFLRGRDSAIQQLYLACGHERHAATVLEVRTTRPTRDAARLLMLVRQHIEHATLAAPVESITAIARRILPYGDQQLDLLDSKLQCDDEWTVLLDRLRARLGNDAIRTLGLHSEHRPEQAWCIVDPSKPAGDPMPCASVPDRPLWLLEPRPLSRVPPVLGTPERIEAGWWSGEDVRRDYYIAQTPEGARWWLFREAESKKWFLHGLWA